VAEKPELDDLISLDYSSGESSADDLNKIEMIKEFSKMSK